MVPGSTLMYGSSFCMVTRRPRALSSRPIEDAVSPFPREEATPPVTKMCLVTGFQGTAAGGGSPGTAADLGAVPGNACGPGVVGSVVPAVATTSSPPSAPAPAAPPRASQWGLAALALAAATVVLRLPASLADRHLTVDDGVFGASALAMRTGALPYREVFSSQGPLFLPLVWVADLVGFRTLDAPRLLALAAGVGLVLAVFAAALEVTDRPRALLAAGLTAVTGSVLWVTAPLAADGPALALATATVALALVYRRRPSTGLALAAGACLGATV